MDVIIANLYQDQLMNLDIDVIKCLKGEYSAVEIVEMFKNFYYNRLIIDVTALKSYTDYNIFEVLAKGLDPDRIIFLLPEGSLLCTPGFLQYLISYGIYNFTTNVKGISYLIKKPNTYQDVEKIVQMASRIKSVKKVETTPVRVVSTNPPMPESITTPVAVQSSHRKPIVIGVYNVTASAGATTLVYMMMKELIHSYGDDNVLALEIDRNDFDYFYHSRMKSVKSVNLKKTLEQYSNVKIILVDLNDLMNESVCDEVLYLLEPSTLKLNRLVERNKTIFKKLSGKKVLLNQSILQTNDVFNFEKEAGINVFYNVPPLDERKRNSVISDLLAKLGLVEGSGNVSSGKIFGLFRR